MLELILLTALAAAPPAEDLVRALGDDGFRERERAHARLLAMGRDATEALRAGTRSPDLEVRRRCERLLASSGVGVADLEGRVLVLRVPGCYEFKLDFRAGGVGYYRCRPHATGPWGQPVHRFGWAWRGTTLQLRGSGASWREELSCWRVAPGGYAGLWSNGSGGHPFTLGR